MSAAPCAEAQPCTLLGTHRYGTVALTVQGWRDECWGLADLTDAVHRYGTVALTVREGWREACQCLAGLAAGVHRSGTAAPTVREGWQELR